MAIEQRINDLLDQLEASQTYAEYMPLRSKCVQALDSYEVGVGIGPSRAGQWDRFTRICAKVGPEIRKREYDSIRIYSPEELRAYQQAKNEERALADAPVNLLTAVRAAGHRPTLNTVADLICAAVASSTSLDAVGERVPNIAAE